MSEARPTSRIAVAVLTVVIVVLAIVTVQLLSRQETPEPGIAAPSDAVAAYDAALTAGRPIYVLFHSRTCQSCVEIDAVAQVVVPEYEGRITFVDALTDDPSGRELASRLSFQFIPTSFFLRSDGSIVDMYTGVLDADAMRARLDDLLQDE